MLAAETAQQFREGRVPVLDTQQPNGWVRGPIPAGRGLAPQLERTIRPVGQAMLLQVEVGRMHPAPYTVNIT